MMKKKWFKLQSVALYLLLTLLTYYAPELMLFYLVCGVYDVSRNSNLDLSLLREPLLIAFIMAFMNATY